MWVVGVAKPELAQNEGPRRIDLHHHFFPPSLNKAKKNVEVGWRTPEGNLPWDPTISLAFMDAHGIETAILSLPSNPVGVVSSENCDIARTHNQSASQICQKYPGRFGFFAGLPFLNNTTGNHPTRH
jgi:predicted TIM-barrel fold metal-dependent hydrolase